MIGEIYEKVKILIRIVLIALFILAVITKNMLFALLTMYTVSFIFLCFSLLELEKKNKVLFLVYISISLFTLVFFSFKLIPLL